PRTEHGPDEDALYPPGNRTAQASGQLVAAGGPQGGHAGLECTSRLRLGAIPQPTRRSRTVWIVGGCPCDPAWWWRECRPNQAVALVQDPVRLHASHGPGVG